VVAGHANAQMRVANASRADASFWVDERASGAPFGLDSPTDHRIQPTFLPAGRSIHLPIAVRPRYGICWCAVGATTSWDVHPAQSVDLIVHHHYLMIAPWLLGVIAALIVVIVLTAVVMPIRRHRRKRRTPARPSPGT
ncbi:MAG: hypothetical protein ACRD0J_03270, partial [Acidimicrobiales bacterium]